MGDHRFAESAAAEDVEILFARAVVAARERPYGRCAGRRHAVFAVGGDVAFADIGEVMPVERGAEVGEGQRLVVVLEHLVRDIGVSARRDAPRIVAPELAIGVTVVALDRKPVEEFARLSGAGVWIDLQARVQEQAVAGDLEQPPARQHVEADRRDARRGRAVRRQFAQQGFAQRCGNPAVDAMTDDEVEDAVGRSDLVEAAGAQNNVGEAETFDAGGARGDLDRREIDADEARLRPGGGERNDVAARGAADFEHPRGAHRRRRQPEPQRRRSEPRRLLPGERLGRVGGLVVARARPGDALRSMSWGRRTVIALGSPVISD